MKSKVISVKTNVICDMCGAEICLSDTSLLSKHYPDGIWIDYFKCGKCGMVYPYLFTDPELRKLRKARGFRHSAVNMKLKASELKMRYIDRIKDL